MKRSRRKRGVTRRLALVRWLVPIFIGTALLGQSLADSYDFSAFPKPAATKRPLGETADLKLGPNAAPWLPRFIEARRAKLKIAGVPRQIALFRGDGSTSYLAVWWPSVTRESRFDFYKIANTNADIADVGPVRTVRAYSVSFDHPSGLRIFAGEPPVAAITIHWYSLADYDADRRLILLTGNTVDITPKWAGPIVDVVDIDGDGQYEVVTSDDLWQYLYDTPPGAKLRLPVVLKRANGDFVPACRQFDSVYRKWIAAQTASARDERKSPLFRAQALTAALLGQVQIGKLADARRTATALVDFIRTVRQAHRGPRNGDADLQSYDPDDFRDSFRRLLKRASRFASLPCVLEAGADTRYQRIERYRVLRD